MNLQKIIHEFEKKIISLFQNNLSEREDSRAFGAMVEKIIIDNWKEYTKNFRLLNFM